MNSHNGKHTSTKGIILHKTNYSESSLVVQILTENYGKVGVLVQGVKKAHSRTKAALFEPLTLVEVVGNFTDTSKLIRPREIKLHKAHYEIRSNIAKRSIALFLGEILYKTIREPNTEPELFSFIEETLDQLDSTAHSTANFHIGFLIRYTYFLGIQPQPSPGKYFDLHEGNFTNNLPSQKYLMSEMKENLFLTLSTPTEEIFNISFSSLQRKQLLYNLIEYYKIHLPQMGEIKSHSVLETVFAS